MVAFDVSVVDLPLVGGHPALDLINTKETDFQAPIVSLRTTSRIQ